VTIPELQACPNCGRSIRVRPRIFPGCGYSIRALLVKITVDGETKIITRVVAVAPGGLKAFGKSDDIEDVTPDDE